MSFADYLRDRISSDYKNLMIQKLEEIRQQTELLKTSVMPSFQENQQTLRDIMRNEFEQIQTLLGKELDSSQARLSDYFQTLISNHISSWYSADVSEFEQQLEVLLSDIVSNLPVPPKKKSTDLESLSDLMRKIDQENTQSEILNNLLMHIAGWVDRAVLFVVKGDQASGWAALGLAREWDTSRVRALKVDLNKQTVLAEVVRTGAMAYGAGDKYPENGEIYAPIGNKFPRSVVACPIQVRGKIAGILYCDLDLDFAESPDVPELLFLATRSAGLAIDLLPIRPKVVTIPPKETHMPAPVAEAPLPAVEEVSAAPPQPSVEEVPPPPEPEPAPEEPVAEMEVMEEEAAEGTVVMPVMTTAPVAPVIPEEEQKLHDDAKRFARLLVSEIKLYNEAQVAAGREHRDLYDRLREDIERSRRMYMDRVPAHIHTSTNYFYEELVRTLANGDPTLLGM